jgi:hypothetical protein
MSIVDPDFPVHHKTRELEATLGHNAGMYVIRLWCFCHARKTDLVTGKAATLASICGWEGRPGKFVSALQEIGFLDAVAGKPDVFRVHEWMEKNIRIFTSQENDRKGGRKSMVKEPTRQPVKNLQVDQNGSGGMPVGQRVERVEKSREEGNAGPDLVLLYRRFIEGREDCSAVSEMAFRLCLKEFPEADPVEAVESFLMLQDGAPIVWPMTPIKHLRNYLSHSELERMGKKNKDAPETNDLEDQRETFLTPEQELARLTPEQRAERERLKRGKSGEEKK